MAQTSINVIGGVNQYIGSEFLLVKLAMDALNANSQSTLAKILLTECQGADNPAQVLGYIQEMLAVVT
jgi:hypothetical protein